jgi:hypothetical protein
MISLILKYGCVWDDGGRLKPLLGDILCFLDDLSCLYGAGLGDRLLRGIMHTAVAVSVPDRRL